MHSLTSYAVSISAPSFAHHWHCIFWVWNNFGVYELLHFPCRSVSAVRSLCTLRQLICEKLFCSVVPDLWPPDVRKTRISLGDDSARLPLPRTRSIPLRILGLRKTIASKEQVRISLKNGVHAI